MNEPTLQPNEPAAAPSAPPPAPPTISVPPDPPAPEAFLPQLDGYRITGRLGEGGMGVVWRAEQLSTHRQVALKLMSAASFGSERAKARFNREVELTARLEHPNIARVYDGGLNRGVYFYAMELLEGQPLDRYVQQHQLDRRDILRLFQTICQAVQHAHQRGIIHRDLKPSNIVVTDDGQPHVLDFGLAKTLLHGDAGDALSLDGEISGTPAFMSPEQAAGRLDQIDTRTDVYSLGVILHVLLAGRNPHDLSGTYLDVIKRIVDVDVPSPRLITPQLDRELEALLLKPLAKDPGQRYASAGEFAEDIGRYLAGEPLRAKPATLRYVLGKRLRKYRVPLAIAGVVLASLLGVAVYAYVQIARQRNVAEKALAAFKDEQEHRRADREKSAPAFVDAARALINQQAFGPAQVSTDLALEYNPAAADALLLRAALRVNRGELRAALKTLQDYQRHRPDDAAANDLRLGVEHGLRHGTQMAAGQMADALRRLELYSLADAQYAAAGQMLDAYKARVDAAWPGASSLLRQTETGGLWLDLSKRDKVTDLSPLKGMPLETLLLVSTRVADLRPLVGMPLRELNLARSQVTDLTPLKGMKLKRLWLGYSKELKDLSPLAGMELEEIGVDGTAVTDLSPLRGMPLWQFTANDTVTLGDISPLKGAPLKRLSLYRTQVRNITPLKGMQLELLNLTFTNVYDISPLKGMPLQRLQIDSCSVYDISALAGMPIKELFIQNTRVDNLTVLKDMPLQRLVFTPHQVNVGLEALRGKPGLQYIADGATLADQPSEEFWRRYDAGKYKGDTAEDKLRGLYRSMKRATPATLPK